jgi:hypothetical protein
VKQAVGPIGWDDEWADGRDARATLHLAFNLPVAKLNIVTATLKEHLHITLMPEAEETASLPPQQEYDVTVMKGGVILMRPKQQPAIPKRTLMEHLEALRGLEIERRRDSIAHRVQL